MSTNIEGKDPDLQHFQHLPPDEAPGLCARHLPFAPEEVKSQYSSIHGCPLAEHPQVKQGVCARARFCVCVMPLHVHRVQTHQEAALDAQVRLLPFRHALSGA